MRMRRTPALTVIVSALLLVSRIAAAAPTVADRETARALMDEGDADVAKNDLNAALKAYRGADAIMHVPSTAIEVALTEEKLGLLLEAREVALAIIRMPQDPTEPAAFKTARDKAAALAETLATRIPSIQVRLAGLPPGAHAVLTVDGEAVPEEAITLPRRANPGAHAIVVSADGCATVHRDVTVAEKDTAVIEINLVAGTPDAGALPKSSAPPPSSSGAATIDERHAGHREYVYGLFGLAGAGVVVGSVTGILSLSKVSSAHCSNNVCSSGAQGDISTARTLAWTSDIAFGVGIASAAVATLLYLRSPDSPPAGARASLHLTGGPITSGGRSGGLAAVSGSF